MVEILVERICYLVRNVLGYIVAQGKVGKPSPIYAYVVLQNVVSNESK